MKKLLAFAILAAVLSGCGPDPTMPMRKSYGADTSQKLPESRINVEQIGIFYDELAYNGRRGVYIITDSKTGKEYIGVSGVGISETGSHQSGKQTISDER